MGRTLAVISVLVSALLQESEDKPGRIIMKETKDPRREWALFIPSGYDPRTPLPFVLDSHGKGGTGRGEANLWDKLAQKHNFILACPNYSFAQGSEGSPEEDERVTLEVYDYVTKHLAIDKRFVMISGFSAGGLTTYRDGPRHPDKFTYWCPRSPNWYPGIFPGAEQLKKCVNIPVYIFYGSKDHKLILDQAPKARDALVAAGFKNVKFEQVEGLGHSSRPNRAAEWFTAEIEAAKKREQLMVPVVRAMAAADRHLEKGKLADAIHELVKAARHMKDFALGDDAARRIEKLADAEIEKAAAGTRDEGEAILEAAQKAFAGTDALNRITKRLEEMKK